MTLLRHQRQELSSNCGPACVAILAGTSQEQACRAMFGDIRSRNAYSFWPDIRRALKQLGVKHGKRANYVSKWESVPDIAIVGCSRRNDGYWHWVVCSPAEGLIYDPEKERPIPFANTRRKPFSYLTVVAAQRRIRPGSR
jgi:hypothetical protein